MQSKKISYMLFESSVTVILKGKTFNVKAEDSKYNEALRLIDLGDEQGLISLLDIVTVIKNQFGVSISPQGIVTYTNKEGVVEALPTSLNKTILRMFDRHKDLTSIQPLINFWDKLKLNPAYRPLNFLFDFIVSNNIVINEKGNLILYKIVTRTDDKNVFLDNYTRTFKHVFGQPVSMPRNQVDDDINKTCSFGLHLCCWQYLPHYGRAINGVDAILLCEVEPQNIVAIPTEYNNSKIRCCEYTPLEEYTYERGEIQDVLYNITLDNELNNTSTKSEEDYESAITNDWPEDDLEDDLEDEVDYYYKDDKDSYLYEDDEKEDDD